MRPRFASMCEGPNEDRVREHDERARFHALMAKFYRLDEREQLAVMCVFDALGGLSDD